MNNNKKLSESREGTIGKELSFGAKEAYKRLRTNISFSFSSDEKCHVIGVTSSMRGEGKTTTTVNMAYTFAESGKRVLLIDADMRLPQIHVALNQVQTPGLSNILSGNCDGYVVRIYKDMPNLNIVCAGDISPNPSELLASNTFSSIIDLFKEKYDYIFIDLPPVGAVADALIVSKCTNGMVVVVRENYVDKKALDNTVRQLMYHKANIVGFVMNYSDSEEKYYKKGYYKKKEYGSEYGYGDNDNSAK